MFVAFYEVRTLLPEVASSLFLRANVCSRPPFSLLSSRQVPLVTLHAEVDTMHASLLCTLALPHFLVENHTFDLLFCAYAYNIDGTEHCLLFNTPRGILEVSVYLLQCSDSHYL